MKNICDFFCFIKKYLNLVFIFTVMDCSVVFPGIFVTKQTRSLSRCR